MTGRSLAVSAPVAIAIRTTTAIVGGYALASAFAVCLSYALPPPRAEAVLAATLLSFLVAVAAPIWAFATRTLLGAVLGVLGPTLLLAGAALLMQALGVR